MPGPAGLALTARELVEATAPEIVDLGSLSGPVDGVVVCGSQTPGEAAVAVAAHAEDLVHGDGQRLAGLEPLEDVGDLVWGYRNFQRPRGGRLEP